MTLTMMHVTVDCADAARLAGFWAEALGWGARWRTLADPEGIEFCVVAGQLTEEAEHA